MDPIEQLDRLIASYARVLSECHDALAPDVPQETRDALRFDIKQFTSTQRRSDAESEPEPAQSAA